MKLDLDGKIALVTGGTRGIGRACAQALAAEGARVAIVARTDAAVASSVTDIGCAFGMAADLSDAEAAAAMLAEVESGLGPIDILVNCAGAARRVPAEALGVDAYRAAMDAKFFSYVNVMDPAIKTMAERRSGVIINVIGDGGRLASPVHIAGGSANAALMLVTAGLANAYAPKGIRVIGLNPALTKTERVTERMRATATQNNITEAEALAQEQASIPIGRFAEPSEIADLVTFLSSGRASYMTGVNIKLDGAKNPTAA